eukprot:g30464.t1
MIYLLADSGATVTYAQTAIDLVYAGRYITAGDIDASLSFEGIDRSGELTHQKAGLLTMPCGSASLFDPRFQITLGSVPEFDGCLQGRVGDGGRKQLVFGQLLASPGSALHPLHWIEAMGTANGTPREEISIKACGECSAEECQVLLGAMVMAAQVDRTPEHQVDRYGRTGHMHGELEDAVTHDNLTQVLELTAASASGWSVDVSVTDTCDASWPVAASASKAGLFEVQLKSLVKALKKVEFKAGDVKGYENRLALDAKSQLGRVMEVVLNRPKELNAFNPAMWIDLRKCFEAASSDPDTRCIVIHGGASRVFTAGLDLKAELTQGAFAQGANVDLSRKALRMEPTIQRCQEGISSIERCRKPVVAAFHSGVIGAGVDLASACDIRYCSEDSERRDTWRGTLV